MTGSTDTGVMLGMNSVQGSTVFRFSVGTAAYQRLRRDAGYRWEQQDRIGRLPAQQFLGADAQAIELEGVIYPEYRGGLKQLDTMRAIAGQGEPFVLVSGLGDVMGQWVILRVEERQSNYIPGGVPLKQEFSMQLRQYGED